MGGKRDKGLNVAYGDDFEEFGVFIWGLSTGLGLQPAVG